MADRPPSESPDAGLTATRSLIKTLFAGTVGLLELRALPSTAREFCEPDDDDAVRRFVTEHRHENVYFGVATRRDSSSGRLPNCQDLPALFVDIDFKTIDEHAARARLIDCPVRPTGIVESGSGLHPYWKLREPIDPAEAKPLLRRLAGYFGGDLAAAEGARVLRLPDTLNHKTTPPRPVTLAMLDPEAEYNPSDFDDWLPMEPEDGSATAVPFTVPPTIASGSRNDTLYRTSRSLVAKGLSEAAVTAAVLAENAAKCAPPLAESEVREMVRKAVRQADRPGFERRAIESGTIESKTVDETCPTCQLTDCSGCGLNPEALTDAVDVARQGQEIERVGIPYVVDGIVPAYGGVGFLVAYAKVGKTTLNHALGAAVAAGLPFLGRRTTQARVLVIAAEDPPEYTAYVARHIQLADRAMTFYRAPLVLNEVGLAAIVATVQHGGYGLVIISSWQAVIKGLLQHENDNAGALVVAENAKAAARRSGIPWLIDAHAGKGEDGGDDADPTKALRGASSPAGAVDYLLSLRYGKGTFSSERRLSGKGRFVSFEPVLVDFDPQTSAYTCLGGQKDALTASTWQLISETGALTDTPRSLNEIAQVCGLVDKRGRLGSTPRRQLAMALKNRPEVGREDGMRRGQKTALYRIMGKTA